MIPDREKKEMYDVFEKTGNVRLDRFAFGVVDHQERGKKKLMIRLTGKGPGGADLVVITRLKPHRLFTRRGDDLELDVPVTLREALLGSEVPVGTLKGRVLLKVPAGTQNGRQFRLKGQGMPHLKGDGHGDLIVRIRVVLPTDLSDGARAAVRGAA